MLTITIFETIENINYKKYDIIVDGDENTSVFYLSDLVKDISKPINIYLDENSITDILNINGLEYNNFDKETESIFFDGEISKNIDSLRSFYNLFCFVKTTNDIMIMSNVSLNINDIDDEKLQKMFFMLKEDPDSSIKIIEYHNKKYTIKIINNDLKTRHFDFNLINKVILLDEKSKKLIILNCPFGTYLKTLGIREDTNLFFIKYNIKQNEKIVVKLSNCTKSSLIYKNDCILTDSFFIIDNSLILDRLIEYDNIMKKSFDLPIILNIYDL